MSGRFVERRQWWGGGGGGGEGVRLEVKTRGNPGDYSPWSLTKYVFNGCPLTTITTYHCLTFHALSPWLPFYRFALYDVKMTSRVLVVVPVVAVLYIYICICSSACPPYYPVLTRARNFINRVSHVCCLLFEFAHNVVFKLSTLDGRLNSVTNEKRTQRDAREYIYIYVYVCNEYSVDFSIIFSLVDYERMYRRARRTFLLPVFEKTKRINLLKNAIFNSKNKFIIIIVYIFDFFPFCYNFWIFCSQIRFNECCIPIC